MNHLRLLLGCSLLALWPGMVPSAAQEWTRFRGPNGSGVLTDCEIPGQWTEADYNWKVTLPGVGHASPVIWGERVFLLSADPQTATRHVLCLRAADGATLWQRDFPSAPHHLHLRNSFASSTPAVDAQHVYVAWSTPAATTLMALDHDGQTVWTRDLGPFLSQHGFGTSPIVTDSGVILCLQQDKPQEDGPRTETSAIVAVDPRTGETRWTTPRLSEVVSYSTPCLYEPAGQPRQLICCSMAQGIYSLDLASGRENWSIDVFEMRTVSSPIVAGDLIVATTGSGGGGNYLVAVRPGPKPEVAYRITTQAPYVPAPSPTMACSTFGPTKASSVVSALRTAVASGRSASAATTRARPSSPASGSIASMTMGWSWCSRPASSSNWWARTRWVKPAAARPLSPQAACTCGPNRT